MLAVAERSLTQYLATIDVDDVGAEAFKAGARARGNGSTMPVRHFTAHAPRRAG